MAELPESSQFYASHGDSRKPCRIAAITRKQVHEKTPYLHRCYHLQQEQSMSRKAVLTLVAAMALASFNLPTAAFARGGGGHGGGGFGGHIGGGSLGGAGLGGGS